MLAQTHLCTATFATPVFVVLGVLTVLLKGTVLAGLLQSILYLRCYEAVVIHIWLGHQIGMSKRCYDHGFLTEAGRGKPRRLQKMWFSCRRLNLQTSPVVSTNVSRVSTAVGDAYFYVIGCSKRIPSCPLPPIY